MRNMRNVKTISKKYTLQSYKDRLKLSFIWIEIVSNCERKQDFKRKKHSHLLIYHSLTYESMLAELDAYLMTMITNNIGE